MQLDFNLIANFFLCLATLQLENSNIYRSMQHRAHISVLLCLYDLVIT